MEELVLNILRNNTSLTLNEVLVKSGINDIKVVKDTLNNLVDNLQVYITRKGKYTLFENSKLQKGLVTLLNDGSGYVILEDYDRVFVSQSDLHCAKDGDVVAIEIVSNKAENKVGRVVKIKRRPKPRYVGELVIRSSKSFIKVDDKDCDVHVDYYGDTKNLVDGSKVVVELNNKIGHNLYDCNIVEVLGHKDDPKAEVLAILRKYGIETEFPEEVIKELENIKEEVTEEDIIECLSHGGEDLRDERTVTIDGNDTKDFDDAITIKKIGDHYDLKVSIANVSVYVPADSATFNNATKRGTSEYFPGGNEPMLERKLSNGICSLNPNVDRLALTFEMLFDKDGNRVDYAIYDSIIKSKKRMTYDDVNKVLEEEIILEGYEEYVKDLKLMEELYLLLRKKKIERGFIDFEIDECKVLVDDHGKVIGVKVDKRGLAERIIEDFMGETGICGSDFLDEVEKNAHIYRVHDLPREDKILRLKRYLELLKCQTDRLNDLSAKNMQMLLNQVKGRKEYLIIARELLKCMQKAYYSIKNIGHFALGLTSTCQVTSPIRRSGDLINHVLIRENLYNISKGSLNKKKLAYLATIASSTERRAMQCESEIKAMKIAEYMYDYIGEEFEGMITHINKNGFYVELPNLIEGFVEISSLDDDIYRYDDDKFALIGRNKGKRYFLGDKIKVVVKGVSKADRIVYFEVSKKRGEKVKKLNNTKIYS